MSRYKYYIFVLLSLVQLDIHWHTPGYQLKLELELLMIINLCPITSREISAKGSTLK